MKFILIAIATLTLFCSCFTSEEPFYDQSDIVKDDRLLGTFDGGDGYRWIVEKSTGTQYHVTLTSSQESCSMKFEGTLFQIGANRFFDMIPEVQMCDSDHKDAPTMYDLIQMSTIQPMHMVVKVIVGSNEVKVGAGELNEEKKTRTSKDAGEFFSTRQIPGAGFTRMIPETKSQHEFLLRFGGDAKLFELKSLKRIPSIK